MSRSVHDRRSRAQVSFDFPRSRRALLAPVLLLAIIALVMGACGDSGGGNVQQQQQAQNLQTVSTLCAAIGGCNPNLTWSNELWNQKTFYQDMNNKALIGYVYLLDQAGIVEAEYQVKGKCSSTESQLTTPTTINTSTTDVNGSVIPMAIPAPQPDGSYGSNENGIFCFLNNAQQSPFEFNAAQWLWVWSEIPMLFPIPSSAIVLVPNGK